MFGLKKGYVSNVMKSKLGNYRTKIESNKAAPRYIQLLNDNMKGIDQDFLEYEIFTEAKNRTCVHVSNGRFDEGDIRIEPAHDGNFIGRPIEVII